MKNPGSRDFLKQLHINKHQLYVPKASLTTNTIRFTGALLSTKHTRQILQLQETISDLSPSGAAEVPAASENSITKGNNSKGNNSKVT